MYTKQEIIIGYYREGKSQRRICQELGISRKTVRKYIGQYEERQKKTGSFDNAFSEYLSEAPAYNSTGVRLRRKLTREVQEQIGKLLEANEMKKLQGLRKQLLKNCDIHELLRQQGFDIGYTTVSEYIKNKLSGSKPKEAFIRQQYQPGELCEFDWGEVKVYIGDSHTATTLYMSVFTSAYSNYRYADLFERQHTLSFQETHADFFAFSGGVYHTMLYDNMRVAVARFVGKYEKEPTEALLQLRGHYGFSHRFCNAYRGNEKGHVERSVEYIRRKAFAVKSRFNTIEEARRWLISTINKLNTTKQQMTAKTAQELFEQESKVLLPAPQRMLCSEQTELRVDKYATVSYHTNRYSVPDHLVGHFVDVKIQSHQIMIYKDSDLLATHRRSYGKHQWVIDINHFLITFKKKPGALASSVALASCGVLKELYEQYFTTAPRDFIDLLDYCHKSKITDEKLSSAVGRLQSSGIRQMTADKLKAILGNSPRTEQAIPENTITTFSRKQLLSHQALMN
jgi:transposase